MILSKPNGKATANIYKMQDASIVWSAIMKYRQMTKAREFNLKVFKNIKVQKCYDFF